jgi:hypothetical protein
MIIAGRKTDWTDGETSILISLETRMMKLQTLLLTILAVINT